MERKEQKKNLHLYGVRVCVLDAPLEEIPHPRGQVELATCLVDVLTTDEDLQLETDV